MCACPNAFHCSLGDWTVEREMRGVGVNVLYKCGGKLVGERTRKPFIARVLELQFADNLAAVGMSKKSTMYGEYSTYMYTK